MKLLTCMSIAGSIPVVICLLMYLIQHADYNYTLGRRLLITGIFFYLIPVQLIKYLIPKDVFPTFMLITDESQLYLSGSLSFTPERQGEYIWMPQWFDVISKIWLAAIIIFAIYQIISFWRELIPFRIIYLIKWKIQIITKYIIWFLMESADHVQSDFSVRKLCFQRVSLCYIQNMTWYISMNILIWKITTIW